MPNANDSEVQSGPNDSEVHVQNMVAFYKVGDKIVNG